MTEYEKGYYAYNWLIPEALDQVATSKEFKSGYWAKHSEVLQFNDDLENLLSDMDL